jgi:hypothetical protein
LVSIAEAVADERSRRCKTGSKRAEPAAWWQLDRGLLALILAALALSLLGLISIALVARREPDLAPAVTPKEQRAVLRRLYLSLALLVALLSTLFSGRDLLARLAAAL